jgi:hypothetical protein
MSKYRIFYSAKGSWKKTLYTHIINYLRNWSGLLDSNQRFPVPKTGGLTRLSQAPIGLLGEIRTPGLKFRKLALYPSELRAVGIGARI